VLVYTQAAFLVPTSLVMHAFWELPEGSPGYQIEFINFAKVVFFAAQHAAQQSLSACACMHGLPPLARKRDVVRHASGKESIDSDHTPHPRPCMHLRRMYACLVPSSCT
jgi:hypothetical protein